MRLSKSPTAKTTLRSTEYSGNAVKIYRVCTYCQRGKGKSSVSGHQPAETNRYHARIVYRLDGNLHPVLIHAPSDGSDHNALVVLQERNVSIHAPNEGSDAGSLGPPEERLPKFTKVVALVL